MNPGSTVSQAASHQAGLSHGPLGGGLPTVGTSRDDCSRWGGCACALRHTHALTQMNSHTLAHTNLYVPSMYTHAVLTQSHLHSDLTR